MDVIRCQKRIPMVRRKGPRELMKRRKRQMKRIRKNSMIVNPVKLDRMNSRKVTQKKIKIIAEYSKSNRSSCKKCANTIPSHTLRLALVSRERGYDMVKWHHLNCFPNESHPIVSVDEINGFSSLKSSDQEAVKKLMAGSDGLPKEDRDDENKVVEGSDEKSLKESKVRKADEAALDEQKESSSKKTKASSKIVAEYAKSSRSSCKKCTKTISANTLRLGSVSRDGQGFDMTKLHHLNCFPTDSQSIISVDEINRVFVTEEQRSRRT